MNPEPFLHNGTLVWTMTTNGYKYITLNLIKSIERTKAPWRLVIVAADKESYLFFKREGYPTLQYTNATHTNENAISRWGSPQFQKYNFIKLYCLNAFAKNPAIKNCIYMDGDIVVYKDFLQDILSRLTAKPSTILIQCDEKEPVVCAGAKEGEHCPNCCTGFIAWAHGADQGIFSVSDRTKWSEHPDDQLWVNTQFREKQISRETLPRNLYPNGAYIPLISTIPEAFLLHFNWRVGATKIQEIKRLNQWLIPY
jgi:hypothetical protein